MPDETQGAGASTTDATEGQQQDAGASPSQAAQEQTAPKPDSANKLIKDFVRERGLTVEQLIEKFTTLEDASQTEQQRMESELNRYKADAETATSELRELRARDALRDAIAEQPSIKGVTAVVDLAIPLLTYGDDGKPDNVTDALDKVKAKYPDLFPAAAGSGDGGKGGNGATTTDMNAMIRRAAGRSHMR